MKFLDGVHYEREMLDAFKRALHRVAQLASHQQIAGDRHWEIDLLSMPFDGAYSDVPHIFEFKYSASPTLPTAVVSQVLHKFAMLDRANPDLATRFALVTNGRLPGGVPDGIVHDRTRVFEGAHDPSAAAEAVRQWMSGAS